MTGDRQNNPTTPLYKRILGDRWEQLPPAIRDMHDVDGRLLAAGRVRLTRGRSLLSRIAAVLIGFPAESIDTAVDVEFVVADGIETWTRRFGDETFHSHQFAGRGRDRQLLCERFGPMVFAMALVTEKDRLRLILRRWRFFGIPMPMWLCPRSDSYETDDAGRFRFHVDIWHPLTGPIVRYEGWLEPTPASRAIEFTV